MNHEMKQYRVAKEPPTPLKWLLLILLVWLFAMLQSAFLSYVPIFGATVELTAALILLSGWKRGPVVGAVLGMIGGVLLDALMGQSVSILPLLLFAFGAYAAFAAKQLFDHPLTYMIMTLPAYIVIGIWRAVNVGRFSHLFAVMFAGVIGSLIVYIPAAVKFFRGTSKGTF